MQLPDLASQSVYPFFKRVYPGILSYCDTSARPISVRLDHLDAASISH